MSRRQNQHPILNESSHQSATDGSENVSQKVGLVCIPELNGLRGFPPTLPPTLHNSSHILTQTMPVVPSEGAPWAAPVPEKPAGIPGAGNKLLAKLVNHGRLEGRLACKPVAEAVKPEGYVKATTFINMSTGRGQPHFRNKNSTTRTLRGHQGHRVFPSHASCHLTLSGFA